MVSGSASHASWQIVIALASSQGISSTWQKHSAASWQNGFASWQRSSSSWWNGIASWRPFRCAGTYTPESFGFAGATSGPPFWPPGSASLTSLFDAIYAMPCLESSRIENSRQFNHPIDWIRHWLIHGQILLSDCLTNMRHYVNTTFIVK